MHQRKQQSEKCCGDRTTTKSDQPDSRYDYHPSDPLRRSRKPNRGSAIPDAAYGTVRRLQQDRPHPARPSSNSSQHPAAHLRLQHDDYHLSHPTHPAPGAPPENHRAKPDHHTRNRRDIANDRATTGGPLPYAHPHSSTGLRRVPRSARCPPVPQRLTLHGRLMPYPRPYPTGRRQTPATMPPTCYQDGALIAALIVLMHANQLPSAPRDLAPRQHRLGRRRTLPHQPQPPLPRLPTVPMPASPGQHHLSTPQPRRILNPDPRPSHRFPQAPFLAPVPTRTTAGSYVHQRQKSSVATLNAHPTV